MSSRQIAAREMELNVQQPGSGTPIKILCVDDEVQLLDLIEQFIAPLGMQVLKARDGGQAIAMIKEESERLAAVISDFSMPGKDGFELRKAMLEEHKQIPFIMISGHISRESALQAIDLKISAFLEKPFEASVLVELVKKESADRIKSIQEEDEMLAGFAQEAEKLIDEIEGLILQLEDNPSDGEAINRIYACVHTIKGASGFFKPDTLHRFAHKYEDFLSKFKQNPNALSANSVSKLLKGLDVLKMLRLDLAGRSKKRHSVESLAAIFDGDEKDAPSPASPAEEKKEGAPKAEPAKSQHKTAAAELRVSVSILEQFMEMSGELTVLRNMVNKTARIIEAERQGDENLSNLLTLLGEMYKINVLMQDQVASLKKIPLDQVFRPLTRIVRDLATNLKKQIQFETSNGDLRVDHSIAEVLNKCLVHVIRNSADHGIESPEQRKTLGKEPKGKISIEVQETAEDVIIRVRDDGRGIDPGKIKAKAIEKGILSAQAAAEMDDNEARMLIFEPGFSTAEKVTDVSGRGVGTDMVKGTILSMGGHIELESEVGLGTEFVFRLPLPKSALIINSLLVKVKNQVFAIPQDCITRVIRLSDGVENDRVKPCGSGFVFQDRDEMIPIVDLPRILGMARESASSVLIQIRSKNGVYCLQVQEVLDIEDTVIKNPGKWLGRTRRYSGATFLPDGRVGLVLDVDQIAENSGIGAKQSKKNESARNRDSTIQGAQVEQILVFETHGNNICGVRQSEVFRLEEFACEQIQYSGEQPVVVYRGRTIPLLLHECIIGNREPSANRFALPNGRPCLAIIALHEQRYFGFPVKSIRDLVSPENNSELGRSKSRALIVEGKVINVLRLYELIETFQARSDQRARAS